ncbi:MAG TPA: ComEC/Rec2 family competence protein, partial [Kineosporiaceae bacterium]|nr:ComEC/Rec2 family competence protein [Kineosporiaceae bacterium]
PWLSRSAGFALSCAATGALLLLAPVWSRRWARRLPAPLAAALAVPAAAQAVCGPLVILLQPSVSVVAVPANLLAEPAVAPATVAGVLAALLGVVWPGAAHLAAWCGSLATGWVALVAHRAAQAPGAALPWPSGVPGALLLAVLTAGLVAVSVWPAGRPGSAAPDRRSRPPDRAGLARPAPRDRSAAQTGSRGPGWRPAMIGGALVIAVLAGWVLGPRVPLPGRGAQWPPAGWLVVQCDVGQGDAMVLRSGPDRAVLVDAGPLPEPVDGCLHRLGVRHLDLVMLTHDHADHVLGLPGALNGRSVSQVVVSRLDEPAENARLVRTWAAAAGATVAVGAAGLAGEAGQLPWKVRWQVLAADLPPTAGSASSGGRDPGPEGEDGTRVNEASLVSAWQVGGPGGMIRVIELGDLEVEGQQRLAARLAAAGESALAGPVDVVKVAHHGSAKQDPALYRMLAPRVAVIGVGAGNDYGHPAPSALSMLRAQGPAVFRTDRSGDIAVLPSADGALHVTAEGS